MLFDQPPAELPVATVVPRSGREQIAADVRAWVAAKWQWFKPRTIPMVVAFVGMFAVIGSASYLRDYARRAPERLTATDGTKLLEVSTSNASEAPTGRAIASDSLEKQSDPAYAPRCGAN